MNKNKGFIGIGLIVAIVLGIVVVGGGAYYLGKSGSKSVVINPENILPNNEDKNLPVVENKPTGISSFVTVISPNGGEVYKDTDKITIKWKGVGKDRAAIYLRFSSGEWCFIKDVPASDMNYNFVPSGHNCGEGRGMITSGEYKVTLILYENSGMAPEPGTAFATSYNDGDDASYNIDSSDNSFTIDFGKKTISKSSCMSDKGNLMTFQKALEIAKASSCNNIGKFTGEYGCNKNSGGLVDVYIEPTNKPGCAFACRISIDTEKAEEGWMCTGAL